MRAKCFGQIRESLELREDVLLLAILDFPGLGVKMAVVLARRGCFGIGTRHPAGGVHLLYGRICAGEIFGTEMAVLDSKRIVGQSKKRTASPAELRRGAFQNGLRDGYARGDFKLALAFDRRGSDAQQELELLAA